MKSLKILLLLFGMLFLSFQPVSGAVAPEGVNEIIEEMAELEQGFENGNWDEALEATKKIEKELQNILTESKQTDQDLEKSLASLKTVVLQKNEEKTEVSYILFQKHFFNFISIFDYDVHPLLAMIEKFVVEESAEALEKGDFEDVASEMAEAGNLMKQAKPLLMEKGVSEEELSAFNKKIVATVKAAKKNNADEVTVLLNEIQEMYASFMAKAK